MKTLAVIIFFSIAFYNISTAQSANAYISFSEGKKEVYGIGDTVQILLKVNIPPEICSDGMQRAKIYLSGLEIHNQSEWQQKNSRTWEKQMVLVVVSNKKGMGKVTALRKADKGEFFVQEKINISE